MLNHLQYSFRHRLGLRLIPLLAVVLVNLFFGVLSLTNAGMAVRVTAVSVCGLVFCGQFIVNVICDADQIRSLFSAPSGYLAFLTPTPGWQLLLSRLLPILVFDLVGMGVSVFGIAFQGLLLAGGVVEGSFEGFAADQAIPLMLVYILNYAMFVLAVFFAVALCKSFFERFRGKVLLGIVITAAVLYLFSWADAVLLLFPAGQIRATTAYGFTSVTVQLGLTPAVFTYLALMAVKCAVLFFAASTIMERKINL